MNPTLHQISTQENLGLRQTRPLHGGDINQVFYGQSSRGEVVIKINTADRLPGLFAKEANGLEELRKANAFLIPEVLAVGQVGDQAYLILEYLESAAAGDWAAFGRQLAQLHRQTTPRFGFYENNYIGSLPQYNDAADRAADFFIQQRLEPQFRMAAEQGYHFEDRLPLYRKIEELLPDEPPALLHGDLWSGNFLTTTRGFALIDPAVCYGPREMDLAMMQLFGGFPQGVFAAYEEEFPTASGLAERIPLYQLYYILVHVNLFGGNYYLRARELVRRF